MKLLFTYSNPDEVQFFKGSCYQTALGCMQVTEIDRFNDHATVSLKLCSWGTPPIIYDCGVLSIAIIPMLSKLFKKEGCKFDGLWAFSILF